MKILYVRPGHVGWSSVTRMVALLGRCLDADIETVDADRSWSHRAQQLRRLPRRRGRKGDLLVVAPMPEHLNAVLRADHFLGGWTRVSAWIVDSFRDDTIPNVARALGHFDQLFVTDAEVVDTWEKVTRTPTTWIPFGTDALDANWQRTRTVDVRRVGRQPPQWDDDTVTAQAAHARGLRFAGRPDFGATHEANNDILDRDEGSARFTVSFANLAAPADYTHDSLEYLTARWLDAAANGASVAGISPRCEASQRLLWPEATLELGDTDLGPGLDLVAEAVSAWTPERARLNHVRSLERTDWRWRFSELTDTLELDRPATLARELDRLRRAISERAKPETQ